LDAEQSYFKLHKTIALEYQNVAQLIEAKNAVVLHETVPDEVVNRLMTCFKVAISNSNGDVE
jgi:hypothetical protein